MLREENEVYRVSLEKSEHVIKNLKGEADYLGLQVEQLRTELATAIKMNSANTFNSFSKEP